MDSAPTDTPLVTFYRFFPDIRMPQRADNSAAGSIPTRAFRYCEAIKRSSCPTTTIPIIVTSSHYTALQGARIPTDHIQAGARRRLVFVKSRS